MRKNTITKLPPMRPGTILGALVWGIPPLPCRCDTARQLAAWFDIFAAACSGAQR